MKKKLIMLGILGVSLMGLVSCDIGYNKQIFDTTFKFDKAIISLPNGAMIEGEIQSWKDFQDGDQIQVKINGKTYLVHSSNIALINEG